MVDTLKKNIKDGIYSIGEPIVPQEFERMRMKDGVVYTDVVTVDGI